MTNMLLTLTEYNVWANKRITGLLNELPRDILNAPVQSSFPTIRKTIYHIWDTQVIWLERLRGVSPVRWPSEEFDDDFAGYDLYFNQQSEDFRNFVAGKPEIFFNTVCFYKTLNGKEYQSYNWEIIVHCMNHSTYHRGQLITLLRNLEATDVVSTDFILYLREKQNG